MIIDNHDGYVARTRVTVDEAQFLINCIDAWLVRGSSQAPRFFDRVSPQGRFGGVDAGHVRQILADIVKPPAHKT